MFPFLRCTKLHQTQTHTRQKELKPARKAFHTCSIEGGLLSVAYSSRPIQKLVFSPRSSTVQWCTQYTRGTLILLTHKTPSCRVQSGSFSPVSYLIWEGHGAARDCQGSRNCWAASVPLSSDGIRGFVRSQLFLCSCLVSSSLLELKWLFEVVFILLFFSYRIVSFLS